jgi:hypothetical protein
VQPLNMQAGEGKQYVMDEGNYGDNAQGLFGWANNNPSSKNAIYDTEFINSAAVLCPILARIERYPIPFLSSRRKCHTQHSGNRCRR